MNVSEFERQCFSCAGCTGITDPVKRNFWCMLCKSRWHLECSLMHYEQGKYIYCDDCYETNELGKL